LDREIVISEKRENIDKGCINIDKNQLTIFPVPSLVEDFGNALSERYLSYALSTIMSRSLPDVRDGLKPAHRRLLYAMLQLWIKKLFYLKILKI
jgi:hypothetical protein